jgi:hypothetical protein
MIYVVEIETANGARASKEYDAPTMRTAWRAMQRDLLRYPRFASSRFGRRADQKSGCPRWRGSGLGGASYHGRLPRTRTGEHHQVREARRRARHEHVQSIASFQERGTTWPTVKLLAPPALPTGAPLPLRHGW